MSSGYAAGRRSTRRARPDSPAARDPDFLTTHRVAEMVIMARSTSGPDVVGAIVRGARDLHDLEIVGILDVLLWDLALIGDAVALAHHHLAEPLDFGAKPAAHHEDQMKAGVVRGARGAAARLELLDGAPDGPADAAVGRFREPEIAIFQKRPQGLARPVGAVAP